MKIKRIVGLGLALVLLVTPLAVMAQDDDELELEEYISEDELLTLSYPTGWFISPPAQDEVVPTVGILNTEEALARYEADEDLATGDQGIAVVIMPMEFLALLGVELPEDPSILDVAEAMVDLLGVPDVSATDEEIAAITIGDAEEIELTDEITGAIIEYSDLNLQGAYIIRLVGEDLVALTIIAAPAGEFDEEHLEAGLQIVASIQYAGSAEDMMAIFMGGPAVEDAPDDATAADLDGEALVEARCTVCHTAERIDNADKDEAGWTATVDRMIGYGAQLDSAERAAVIDYLVATH